MSEKTPREVIADDLHAKRLCEGDNAHLSSPGGCSATFRMADAALAALDAAGFVIVPAEAVAEIERLRALIHDIEFGYSENWPLRRKHAETLAALGIGSSR